MENINLQRYELTFLLPLISSEEELGKTLEKLAQEVKQLGGQVVNQQLAFQGRLAYPLKGVHQGAYYLLQCEIEPQRLAELRRTLALREELLRLGIQKVSGEFRVFAPAVLKEAALRPILHSFGRTPPSPPSGLIPPQPTAALGTAPTSGAPTTATPPVSMEEIDKRLEKILGE